MKIAAALLLALAVALPAHADDVETSIEAALEAYRAGDVKTAKEELDFASQLLAQQKAEGLRGFLPAPLEGWQREDAETDVQAMAAFGGGQMASASYTMGEQDLEIELMADNQMVAAMAGMFSNPAIMGSIGKVERIGGEKAILTPEGDLQAMIDGRIMVQITGSAVEAAKKAYFEAIDLQDLKEF